MFYDTVQVVMTPPLAFVAFTHMAIQLPSGVCVDYSLRTKTITLKQFGGPRLFSQSNRFSFQPWPSSPPLGGSVQMMRLELITNIIETLFQLNYICKCANGNPYAHFEESRMSYPFSSSLTSIPSRHIEEGESHCCIKLPHKVLLC